MPFLLIPFGEARLQKGAQTRPPAGKAYSATEILTSFLMNGSMFSETQISPRCSVSLIFTMRGPVSSRYGPRTL